VKVGDLVRRKQPQIIGKDTFVELHGIILETAEAGCKVLIAGSNSEIRCFLKDSLEVINA
jgi:hypothetical protein